MEKKRQERSVRLRTKKTGGKRSWKEEDIYGFGSLGVRYFGAPLKEMPAKIPSPLVPGWMFTSLFDTRLPTPFPPPSCHRRITLESWL